MGGLVLLCILLFIYFLPSWVATRRHHPQKSAITTLNVLLGWTVLGWIAALVWAQTAVRKEAV